MNNQKKMCPPETRPQNMPVVLQLIPALKQGGVEHAAVDVAEALLQACPHQKTYIASLFGDLLKNHAPKNDHHFSHIPLNLATKNPFRMIMNIFALKKIIQRYGIELVHARSRGPAWSGFFACKWANIPFITTYHGAHRAHYNLPFLSWFKGLYNSIMVRGDAVIAISDFMKQHMLNHYAHKKNLKVESKIVCINEGIDTDFFKRSKPHDFFLEKQNFNILCPSRLTENKGIFVALKAFEALIRRQKKDPTLQNKTLRLRFMRVGKPEVMEALEKAIQKANLQDHIIFSPATWDLRPFYAEADLVIVPSLTPEALGRVSLEALSMECLLIATDGGASKEVCDHGKVGFLVPPHDGDALTKAMETCMMLTPEQREKRHKDGRAHVMTHFSKDSMMKKTMALYNHMTQGKSR